MFLFFFQRRGGYRGLGGDGVKPFVLRIGRDRREPQPASFRAGGRRRFGGDLGADFRAEIGRASWRERVEISGVAVSLKKKTDGRGGQRAARADVEPRHALTLVVACRSRYT